MNCMCTRVSFLINCRPEASNFIKKETLAQVFSCELYEISKNTFFTEHLRVTTSLAYQFVESSYYMWCPFRLDLQIMYFSLFSRAINTFLCLVLRRLFSSIQISKELFLKRVRCIIVFEKTSIKDVLSFPRMIFFLCVCMSIYPLQTNVKKYFRVF